MLKTYRKKRPPMMQLKEASDIAKKMLVKKRISSEKNIFEKMADLSNPPKLPGINPYLPARWTLDAARQMILIITKEWVKKNKGDVDKQEKIEPFFRFAIKQIENEERKFKSRMYKDKMKQLDDAESKDWTIAKIFSTLNQVQTANAMKKFIVDSFAVSVIVKTNDDVSSYLEWFIDDWTPRLNELWNK
jgi:hypothetical protein